VERVSAGAEREGVEAAGKEAVMERRKAELALGKAQLVKERVQLARAEGGREAQFAREREEVEGGGETRRDAERREWRLLGVKTSGYPGERPWGRRYGSLF
jgi:hypothetical protein